MQGARNCSGLISPLGVIWMNGEIKGETAGILVHGWRFLEDFTVHYECASAITNEGDCFVLGFFLLKTLGLGFVATI